MSEKESYVISYDFDGLSGSFVMYLDVKCNESVMEKVERYFRDHLHETKRVNYTVYKDGLKLFDSFVQIGPISKKS